MRTVAHRFLPLEPDERPGDPELGGWRPLRSGIVVRPIPSARHDSSLASADNPASPASLILNLPEALWLVASRVNESALRNALSIVAARLRGKEHLM